MTAYYNEIDKKAAATLRELIRAGAIAPGEVDERDIQDVRPDELRPFSQCHFFAGIGIWSHALRLAGWPDDLPVWTGSCPCQPFSAAGKGGGFADERHLWPAWFHLIQHGKPDGVPVFGEQVASKDGIAWLDLVQSDMEGAGNACWPFDLCAAGFGAPHIRQRLWFVAYPAGKRHDGWRAGEEIGWPVKSQRPCDAGRMADMQRTRLEGLSGHGDISNEPGRIRARPDGSVAEEGVVGLVADADGGHACPERLQRSGEQRQFAEDSGVVALANPGGGQLQEQERKQEAGDGAGPTCPDVAAGSRRPGPVNGHWRNADWLLCRDGRWRPVESGTFPLVNGAPARMGRLRCYGNGIVAQVAQAFIEAAYEQQLGLAA